MQGYPSLQSTKENVLHGVLGIRSLKNVYDTEKIRIETESDFLLTCNYEKRSVFKIFVFVFKTKSFYSFKKNLTFYQLSFLNYTFLYIIYIIYVDFFFFVSRFKSF